MKIVPCRVWMILGNAAKARRQHVLHVKTGIGGQDDLVIVVAELLIADSAVVTRDAVLTAGHVGALVVRDRCRSVKRDRVPDALRTALPHVMRQRKGATDIRSYDLEAPIGRATTRKAEVMQKHRHGNQFGIRGKRAMLSQLGAIEPRAHHMVEKPSWRFSLCLRVGVPNGAAVGQFQIQLPADGQRLAEIGLFVSAHCYLHRCH